MLMLFFDQTCGRLLRHYYFSQTGGEGYRATKVIKSVTADLLIFGASHAAHHYDPRIFEKNLRITTYNAGRDGCPIFYHEAVLRALLTRHRPKLIILDIPPDILLEKLKGNSYDKLAILLPYYRDHEEIRSIIHLRGSFERIKHLSQIYPFNSELLSIVAHNGFVPDKSIEGYLPLFKTMPFIEPEIDRPLPNPVPYKIDLKKKMSLFNFIRYVNQAGIPLVVIVSPYYILGQRVYYLKILESILSEHDVFYWNYSYIKGLCENYKCFRDVSHLNRTGAVMFSKIIAERINNDLINGTGNVCKLMYQ